MGLLKWLLVGAFATAVTALPHNNVKRQITEPPEDQEYDFVVVGGGTAGLTVADRLTEAFPERTVLVIEYGVVEEAQATFEPPGTGPGSTRLTLQSEPMETLNGRSATVMLGMSVGGSSTVNAQFFDRPCRYDMNDWQAIGSPEFDDMEDKWDWDGILPWFKKSVTYEAPTEEVAEKYGYTWDAEAAYGGETPIHSSYPPYQFPIQKIVWDALVEFGIAPRTECAAGDKDGICWVPTSQDPETAERSHSGIGHFADVIEDRSNYDLLVGHKALRLVVDPEKDEAPTVEYRSSSSVDSPIHKIKPKLEVVLSAGAIHTPQILQRSGVGHAAFLEEVGIDVTLDLPGVGYNFHDHGGAPVAFTLSDAPTPDQSSLTSNETFQEESIEQYAERPAQGPYTLAMGSSAIYVSLPNITSDYADIVATIRSQVSDGLAASFLPEGTPETVVAGYEAQLEILASTLENPKYPVLESPWMDVPITLGFLLKPLSRGKVTLNPEDHDADPILHYGTANNPVDLDVMASFIPYFRRFFETETMQALGPEEARPGANVTALEDIKEYVRESVTGSLMHPCCTAAMMPKAKGGVVGPDLKVHDLQRLRVADISIVPIIPGTHTSALAYAIGEKAADIIIRAWSEE